MQSTETAHSPTVTLSSPRTLDEILAILHPLFAQQHQHSFFSSALWWTAWLQALPRLPSLCLIHEQQQLIGACFLSFTEEKRGRLSYKRAWLNQCGQLACDQVWVEYNRIFCRNGNETMCGAALLDYLRRHSDCSELYVSMTTEPDTWLRLPKWPWLVTQQSVQSFKTQLPQKADVNALLAMMSPNTRSQLKRTLKRTEVHYGTCTLEVAEPQTRRHYFDALGQLHRMQWADSKEGSGFDNDIFVSHHLHLLEHGARETCLLRVMAGDTVLGYAYYFLWHDVVFFYCSGVNHAISDNRVKPGLILHLYAMSYFAQQGYTWYDFLGGDSQYKRSLSTHTYEHKHLGICLPTWRGVALALYRKCRERITRAA